MTDYYLKRFDESGTILYEELISSVSLTYNEDCNTVRGFVTGNLYYCHNDLLGYVTPAGVKTEITLGYGNWKFSHIALNKDETEIIALGYGTTGLAYGIKVWRIPSDTLSFVWANDIWNNGGGWTNCYKATKKLIVDKYDNIWVEFTNHYINPIRDLVIKPDNTPIYVSGEITPGSLGSGNMGCGAVDRNGIHWYGVTQWSTLVYLRHTVFNQSLTVTPYFSSIMYGSQYNYVVDATIDKDNILIFLHNRLSDTTNACRITIVNVNDHNNPYIVTQGGLSQKALTYNGANLTSCYNLFTDLLGNIFFSNTTGDYAHTYKIEVDRTDSENPILGDPEIFLEGKYSSTTGNDPYGTNNYLINAWE